MVCWLSELALVLCLCYMVIRKCLEEQPCGRRLVLWFSNPLHCFMRCDGVFLNLVLPLDFPKPGIDGHPITLLSWFLPDLCERPKSAHLSHSVPKSQWLLPPASETYARATGIYASYPLSACAGIWPCYWRSLATTRRGSKHEQNFCVGLNVRALWLKNRNHFSRGYAFEQGHFV